MSSITSCSCTSHTRVHLSCSANINRHSHSLLSISFPATCFMSCFLVLFCGHSPSSPVYLPPTSSACTCSLGVSTLVSYRSLLLCIYSLLMSCVMAGSLVLRIQRLSTYTVFFFDFALCVTGFWGFLCLISLPLASLGINCVCN